MVEAYSPHRDSGGILHLASPTQIHSVSPSKALAQLRRSLSRSPSKGPAFRLVTSKSSSSSPKSPLSPSPLSPQHRASTAPVPFSGNCAPASPLAVPFPPSAKKSRPGARRLSPMRPTRPLHEQRTPAKRALSESSGNGNATPTSSMGSSSGAENEKSPNSPGDNPPPRRFSEKSIFGTSDSHLAPHHALLRKDKQSGTFDFTAKSSPLKRSDGSTNIDLARMGSPSAKRRSLHGASFGSDFNIFDQVALFENTQMERSSSDTQASGSLGPFDSFNSVSPMPKRASSLRRSTLQQRQDKPPSVKSRPKYELGVDFQTPIQSAPNARQRLSLENPVPNPSRDSPFSHPGNLPNASIHPLPTSQQEQSVASALPQRHPLSRSITQSSGSSLGDDSPTHIPPRHVEPRKAIPHFSKSLPLGSMRPPSSGASTAQNSSQTGSFATPENYKLAKPLPAAFMSTGLISKRNKNLNNEQLDLQGSMGHMPDTPCKRPSSMASIAPVPTPNVNLQKSKQARHTLHSFGTPSTPFNPHNSRPSIGALGNGSSVFGSNYNKGDLTRRGSFLSVEGEENSNFVSGTFQSQSSGDFDIPPTPTKQAFPERNAPRSDSNGYGSEHTARRTPDKAVGQESPRTDFNSKSNPDLTPSRSFEGESGNVGDDSPSTSSLRFRNLNAIPSFSNRFNFLGKSRSPTPLSKKPLSISVLRTKHTKSSPLSPASPIYERLERKSPHTPFENMIPPDPSGLSISAHAGAKSPSVNDKCTSNNSVFLPATPTATRDSFGQSGKFVTSVTPVHHSSVSAEVDTSISSRFDKAEVIGIGEFSQVFRVSRKSEPGSLPGYFSTSSNRSSSKTSLPDQIWAVKKTRNPYIGPRDRKRKLQEVEILKTLGRSDHTIQYFDSWEKQDHLYIQTEFCEEGSLDLFLDKVGRKWRLDDFRIWKILLELCLVRLGSGNIQVLVANIFDRGSATSMIPESSTST